MIDIKIYLDGNISDCNYKYIVKYNFTAFTAFRTDNGFRYFMKNYRLKINPKCTQLHDLRDIGKGRFITTTCYEDIALKEIYFWNYNDIPVNAHCFIGLCNGNYVKCFIVRNKEARIVYLPNCNAKNVYIPYDYLKVSQYIG